MNEDLQLTSYDFELPEECIAQEPVRRRDQSRLMVLDDAIAPPVHTRFASILDYLRPGDLLVRNDTRVFPARLQGRKETGGRVEMLLLAYPDNDQGTGGEQWRTAQVPALLKSSKRPKKGATLHFHDDIRATVLQLREDGKVEVEFRYRLRQGECLDDLLHRCGQIPLPPYIRRPNGSTPEDARRYQTRYAKATGSVAAPTAGLHFSDDLLGAMNSLGVKTCNVTLHVGYGTFAP
ncbi:MAG TPA: S-adenosylmethionine:tRNA ribosyltransferase-isomerase, partial [Desulfobulbaceae bacterium]|nr:S-adenosylmethionine:tRNA ribosyltransferase-isomerase [Desulfobulbaceae bacterium]